MRRRAAARRGSPKFRMQDASDAKVQVFLIEDRICGEEGR